MRSNAKERKSLAVKADEFECAPWWFFSLELHFCKTAGDLEDRLALHWFFMKCR